MAAVLAAASYSRIGFSIYIAVRAQRVRVPGGSLFKLDPGTIPLCCDVLPCWVILTEGLGVWGCHTADYRCNLLM